MNILTSQHSSLPFTELMPPMDYFSNSLLRLMASFVLFYTSRVICKGRLTMEEIIFSLKHYWRFVDLEALELQALS